MWEELDFRREVNKHKADLLDVIPELSGGKEPLWMYPRNYKDVRIGCNEFDDVEIVISGYNEDDAKVRAAEFMLYLKDNGFEWWD